MAYDPNSAYQAPNRAYYGQTQQQQQAAVQQGYQGYAQEPYGGQGGYDQGYGHGHAQTTQTYGNGYDEPNGYGQQTAGGIQEQGYSDGYQGGYQRQKARPISGDRFRSQQPQAQHQPQQHPLPQHSQQYERNYDPRYQQRPGRDTPQGQAQHHGHAPQQQQRPTQQQPAQSYQQPAQTYQRPPQSYQQQRPPPERQGHHMPPNNQQRPVDPRSGYQQSSVQQQQRPPPDPRNGRAQPSPQVQVNGNAPKHAAAPQKQEKPKKQTMEEWKAAEKAKMHEAAQSPEILSFDNAFPVFPNTKKDRLKADNRSGGQSAMSHRSSEEQPRLSREQPRLSREQPRPSIADSEQRPSVSRGNSHQNEMPPQQAQAQHQQPPQQQRHLAPQGRPSMDRAPFSFEPAQQPAQEQQQQRPSYERQPSGQRVASPQVDQRQQQWPMSNGPPREEQRSPLQQGPGYRKPAPAAAQDPYQGVATRDEQRSPPQQASGHRQPPPNQDAYQQQGNQQRLSPPQQARPGTASGRAIPPTINTTQARRPQPPTYMDHQPLSPAHIPPRPSTAQAGQSLQHASPAVSNTVTSPLSQYSYSQTPRDYESAGDRSAVPQPWSEEQHLQNGSASDIYDDYHEPNDQLAVPASATSLRNSAEIDAEMPDFDSAAPSQTSMLHKRNQTVDKHLAETPAQPRPPMPVMPQTSQSVQSVQSLPNPKTRQYPQDPYMGMASQKQRPMTRGQPTNEGFDFGVPQQQGSQQYGYEEVYQQPHQHQQESSYGRGAPSVQPPQAPFVNEPPVRRSMDDARQMPYRGPPPQQRGPPNGYPAHRNPGPFPPQQRPEAERNFSPISHMAPTSAFAPQQRPNAERNISGQTVATVQTVWSDPGGQRVPSAPPLRQGLQEPPGRAPLGGPLTQQRSAPECNQPHQQRHSNPDALPQHPTPVRPGLMDGSAQQPAKPPPVRNYHNASASGSTAHTRQASIERPAQPVTHAELDQLRAAVSANPANNKQALLLAKKLVEASTVLASEGGRADPKTTAKNRERYILDAYKRIKKLASAGYPDAQFYLADCYGQGSLGLEVDTKEAFNYYQAAAKQGHPQAAYRTAVCCEMGPEEGGGTRRDFAKALQWYRRAAALGDVAAMYKLGIILLKSLLGQPRNVGEAVTWLKRAAEQASKENPHALHELGTLYEPENTDREIRSKINADPAYAKELFTQAAQLGYKFSQFRLGQAYEYETLGCPIDNRASISWYSKAAAQGEHQAELALSGWYLTGAEGILKQSDTEAYLWARKAAQAEPPLAKAMFAMGYFSETGIGCPASFEEARKWYGRAASYKFPKALERLEELKKSGKARPAPVNGKLSRKDQKRDEAECALM